MHTERELVTGTSYDPVLPKSIGASGRVLMVYQEFGATTVLRGAQFDRNLNRIGADIAVMANTSNEGYTEAAVDGDGENWVVAATRNTPPLLGSERDIVARGVTAGPFLRNTTSILPVESDPNDTEYRPSVTWLGSSTLVGYADESSLNEYDTYVKSHRLLQLPDLRP